MSCGHGWRDEIDCEICRPPAVVVAGMRERIADLERALYAALRGVEVVITNDTPRDLEWKTLDDGERLVRRARK